MLTQKWVAGVKMWIYYALKYVSLFNVSWAVQCWQSWLVAINSSSSPSAAENSSCNIHTQFECGNGECINYQQTCDGIAHCKDKSDEKMQYCGKKHIWSIYTYCTNAESKNRAYWLLSASSEHFWSKYLLISDTFTQFNFFPDNRSCRKGFRPCYNQRCVANSRFCDGIDDCGDNSDEAFCGSESQPFDLLFNPLLLLRAGYSHTNAHINTARWAACCAKPSPSNEHQHHKERTNSKTVPTSTLKSRFWGAANYRFCFDLNDEII